jgi:mono/diheme cytochrome c family protein
VLAGLFSKTAYRVAVLAGVLVFALVVVGCNDTYSEDLTYQVRTDPFKKKAPSSPAEPQRLEPPGRMDELQKVWLDAKGEFYDPAKISAKDRGDLETELKKSFGTPAHPKVAGNETNTALKLDNATLEQGSKLFRRHCLHCHGVAGDGRGPTGPWVNPHPRDYRLGKFKFTSTADKSGVRNRKPSREDLLHVLRTGVEGTSMPSFALLTSEEQNQLVSYVMHLSLRGKAEVDAMRWLIDHDDDEITSISQAVDASLKDELNAWESAEQARIIPPPPKIDAGMVMQESNEKKQEALQKTLNESIERGYKQFTVGSGSCVKCHGDFGRGNNYLWDDWGTVVRPANLTAGVYRGGRRPIDIYYRMHSGITGTGMPGFIQKRAGEAGLTPDEIWDIVNFVEALPYPAMLPSNVRRDIYGEKIAEKYEKKGKAAE